MCASPVFPGLHEQDVHVISTDEKTGIQALEPIHSTHPMGPGHPEAVEFEYKRHGTQVLTANFEVAIGQVIIPSVGDIRTEADFGAHIVATVASDPLAEWIFVVDQLDTHKSTLTRRLLKRGRFLSTEDLKQRILEFIEFFNHTLAKPFRWTYIGQLLMV